LRFVQVHASLHAKKNCLHCWTQSMSWLPDYLHVYPTFSAKVCFAHLSTINALFTCNIRLPTHISHNLHTHTHTHTHMYINHQLCLHNSTPPTALCVFLREHHLILCTQPCATQ
jgi:hypothetical protein